MATLDDAYNQLVEANSHLTDVHNDVQAVKASTDAVNASVQDETQAVKAGFAKLAALAQYTNELLGFEIKQNQTMICDLEKISKQTCELVNQAVRQTAAQELIAANTLALRQLYELANPSAAVEQGRLEGLKRQLEECCPPRVPEPPCRYEPCEGPGDPPRPPREKPEPPR